MIQYTLSKNSILLTNMESKNAYSSYLVFSMDKFLNSVVKYDPKSDNNKVVALEVRYKNDLYIATSIQYEKPKNNGDTVLALDQGEEFDIIQIIFDPLYPGLGERINKQKKGLMVEMSEDSDSSLSSDDDEHRGKGIQKLIDLVNSGAELTADDLIRARDELLDLVNSIDRKLSQLNPDKGISSRNGVLTASNTQFHDY